MGHSPNLGKPKPKRFTAKVFFAFFEMAVQKFLHYHKSFMDKVLNFTEIKCIRTRVNRKPYSFQTAGHP